MPPGSVSGEEALAALAVLPEKCVGGGLSPRLVVTAVSAEMLRLAVPRMPGDSTEAGSTATFILSDDCMGFPAARHPLLSSAFSLIVCRRLWALLHFSPVFAAPPSYAPEWSCTPWHSCPCLAARLPARLAPGLISSPWCCRLSSLRRRTNQQADGMLAAVVEVVQRMAARGHANGVAAAVEEALLSEVEAPPAPASPPPSLSSPALP